MKHVVPMLCATGGHRAPVAGPVPLAEPFRDDDVQRLAELRRMSEQARRRVVPVGDAPFGVGGNDGISGFFGAAQAIGVHCPFTVQVEVRPTRWIAALVAEVSWRHNELSAAIAKMSTTMPTMRTVAATFG